MVTINDFFGMRVKQIRKEKGYTIEQLSFISGVNKNYISDLERGKRNPTLLIVDALSQALEVPVYVFFKPKKKKMSE